MIDERAVVAPEARVHDDAYIGPYAVIGADVEIAGGCRIESHVVIKGPTTVGADNHIFQFSSIGDDPQDKKYRGERTELIIGERNTTRFRMMKAWQMPWPIDHGCSVLCMIFIREVAAFSSSASRI